MIDWKRIGESISEATRSQFSITQTKRLHGGDSNQAFRLDGLNETGKQSAESSYFVKLNSIQREEMFTAEQAGLAAISATHTVRVPFVIARGSTGQHCFLVLEYCNFASQGNSRLLGEQLAAMHQHHAAQFGWDSDNTIGVTPQHNHRSSDWVNFWREQRLGYQLDFATHNGYGGKLRKLGEQVLDALPDLFAGHAPQPSLLHGDLWGGNHAFLADGTPVIFDPATYYGDREADMAMTELFGGFDADFYGAYRAAYPLNDGYQVRKTLYNLYHILNHGNMFGGSYVQQAERMMQNLLAGLK